MPEAWRKIILIYIALLCLNIYCKSALNLQTPPGHASTAPISWWLALIKTGLPRCVCGCPDGHTFYILTSWKERRQRQTSYCTHLRVHYAKYVRSLFFRRVPKLIPSSVSVAPSMKIKGAERGIVPVQVIFCLKEKNQKKINSHRWFFNVDQFSSLTSVYYSMLGPCQGRSRYTICGKHLTSTRM